MFRVAGSPVATPAFKRALSHRASGPLSPSWPSHNNNTFQILQPPPSAVHSPAPYRAPIQSPRFLHSGNVIVHSPNPALDVEPDSYFPYFPSPANHSTRPNLASRLSTSTLPPSPIPPKLAPSVASGPLRSCLKNSSITRAQRKPRGISFSDEEPPTLQSLKRRVGGPLQGITESMEALGIAVETNGNVGMSGEKYTLNQRTLTPRFERNGFEFGGEK